MGVEELPAHIIIIAAAAAFLLLQQVANNAGEREKRNTRGNKYNEQVEVSYSLLYAKRSFQQQRQEEAQTHRELNTRFDARVERLNRLKMQKKRKEKHFFWCKIIQFLFRFLKADFKITDFI